jgi:hypothetical protein
MIVVSLGADLVEKVVESATGAITWRLGGRKLRFKELLDWMILSDMPPRSEAMLSSRKFDPEYPEHAELRTLGWHYFCWLSEGKFGNAQQIQEAKVYIAVHNRLGWFQIQREKSVLLDVTKRYFETLEKYMPAEKGA